MDSKSFQADARSNQDPRATWRLLTLSIYSSPKNLKLHTQRVMYCLDSNLSEYVSGALHDLFVSLGDKGLDLRLRLFNLSSPIMSFVERDYFQRWLAENTDENIDCKHFSGSVFKSKTCKKPELEEGENLKPDKPYFESKSEEVKYKISEGCLDEAQSLLEALYLEKPNNQSAEKELQQFYFHTRNKESIESTITRLKDSGVKIAKTWIDVQEISKTW